MFTNLIRRAKSASICTIDRMVNIRGYYALFVALMVASSVWAEDDVVEIDPNGNLTVFGVLRNLWDFLSTWSPRFSELSPVGG